MRTHLSHTTLGLLLVLSASLHANETTIAPRIYNGDRVDVRQWPALAAIYYDTTHYNGFYGLYCSATVLDANYVLTAAHCLYDGKALATSRLVYTSIAPQMGDESEFVANPEQAIRAAAFYVHPDFVNSSDYQGRAWPNDIAIIRLDQPLSLPAQAYLPLASSADTYYYQKAGQEFVALGYGLTEKQTSGQLLKITLNYVANTDCELPAESTQICTSGQYNPTTQVNNTTCDGDSGGPLYWHNGSEYVQVGITSFGWNGCSVTFSDHTAVFTKIDQYLPWIERVKNDREAPALVVTQAMRDNMVLDDANSRDEANQALSTTSSGGNISIWGLGVLLCCAIRRRKKDRFSLLR
ncbi:trypsin-like serine protease [Vibrio sp. SM6]|uniref:Trypsin-like serine protease n=1 Tax=Vibrio agarilyticus TaxID=2726741 RepID=A0A7X8TSH3_9VIBR|nr:trypsin-like serine protease [Vibrio agarilyticus]NLS13994.1 trypsin-like serine protease [Vibrio agarilyticus]